jgi:hypothetical protein
MIIEKLLKKSNDQLARPEQSIEFINQVVKKLFLIRFKLIKFINCIHDVFFNEVFLFVF